MHHFTQALHSGGLALALLLTTATAQAREDVVELRSHHGRQATYRLPRDATQVQLVQQLDGSCRFHRTWGYDLTRGELWTDRGCGGRFRISREREAGRRDGAHTGAAIAAVAAIAGIALLSQQSARDHTSPGGYPPPNASAPPPPPGYGVARQAELRVDGRLCLDVYRGDYRPGTPVQAYNCHGGEGQRFSFSPSGEIQVRGLCLDIEGGNRNDGARVILWNCSGSANQSWVQRGGQIVSQFNGKCLDLRDGEIRPESPAMVWSCNTSPSQRWWW